jgi:hypothetical protein
MKRDDELPQLRRSVRTSWTAYAVIMVIFAIIALCGWLAGHYIGY